jgi:hypothetical protein
MKLEELKEDWQRHHQSAPASVDFDSLRSQILSSINQMSRQSSNELACSLQQTRYGNLYELGLGALTAVAVCSAAVTSFYPTMSLDAVAKLYASPELISFLIW